MRIKQDNVGVADGSHCVRATLHPDASRGDCPSQTLRNEGTLAV
jgi:hypothetical protein